MRYEQLSVGRLRVDNIEGSGAPIDLGKGQKWYMDGSNGSNGNSGKSANTPLATIAAAESSMTGGQNDTLIFMPGTETITSLVTWNLSNTHLVGSHSATPWSNNCIISHAAAATLSPAVLNSGSDNLFANIHFKFMGGAAGDNHLGLSNTGNGNHYENCWFEGPNNAAQADDVEVKMVRVDGGGNFFKNCIFGSTSVPTNGAALLGWTGNAYRSTFENCRFYHIHDGTAAVMLDLNTAMDISGPQFFNNCQFVGWSDNWATKANVLIRTTLNSPSTGGLIFDPLCMVVGFTDISSGDTVGESPFFFGLSERGAFDGTYSGLVEHALYT